MNESPLDAFDLIALLLAVAGLCGVAFSTGTAAWLWGIVATCGFVRLLFRRRGMSGTDRAFLADHGIAYNDFD